MFCVCLTLSACKDSAVADKQGRVMITDSQYSIRQTHENSYVLDVRGKVKNVGDVDLKKVAVTGYCRSCILEFTSQHWFTSDCDKTENQKDVISYLPAGAEEEFSFEEVAFYFTHVNTPPEDRPENIEVVVESFDVVK
jgi:hypothetical protein